MDWDSFSLFSSLPLDFHLLNWPRKVRSHKFLSVSPLFIIHEKFYHIYMINFQLCYFFSTFSNSSGEIELFKILLEKLCRSLLFLLHFIFSLTFIYPFLFFFLIGAFVWVDIYSFMRIEMSIWLGLFLYFVFFLFLMKFLSRKCMHLFYGTSKIKRF